MKLDRPPIYKGTLAQQFAQLAGYVARLAEQIQRELNRKDKASTPAIPGTDEIIRAAMNSEDFLGAVYGYCEKRRAKEAAQAQEVQTDET